MSVDTTMQSIWYGNSRLAWLLLPFSWLFGALVALRCWLYRSGWLATVRVPKPVIVIGNISVGGTGKTPLVIWLANELLSRGFKIAVISRGYHGAATQWPQVVGKDSKASMVGDEAALIAQQTNAIVVVGPDRVSDAQKAIELGADIIISDDGLQHYRLHRDCEIAVVDGSRMLGNGYLLPAGPLREKSKRLKSVDLLLINQRDETPVHISVSRNYLQYRVTLRQLRSVKTGEVRALDTLRGQQVHVVTGIGNPHAFIRALQHMGIKVLPRILPDHALITKNDIHFGDALPVLMTAKDAVKCQLLDLENHYWIVEADAILDDQVAAAVVDCVQASIQARA